MECLANNKIQEYIDGTLNSVESAMVRDHLIVCDTCREVHEEYMVLEKQLMKPVEIPVPSVIERNVMNQLFPKLPTFSSIAAMIAAGLLMLIAWTYIYFDFANNSIIQAIRLTSDTTSNWIASVINIISSIFNTTYALFTALNRYLQILLNINLGAEVIGLTFFGLFSLAFYYLFRVAYKKLGNQSS